MGYMTSYKRLDNLCRDMYNGENGVTAYIEEMERYSYSASFIPGWKSTYDALKHYRYIRNQIAHKFFKYNRIGQSFNVKDQLYGV